MRVASSGPQGASRRARKVVLDDGDSDAADLRERFPQLVDHPRALPSGVPAVVARTIAEMLSYDPAGRPPPHEVAEALEPVLTALPVHRLSFKGQPLKR